MHSLSVSSPHCKMCWRFCFATVANCQVHIVVLIIRKTLSNSASRSPYWHCCWIADVCMCISDFYTPERDMWTYRSVLSKSFSAEHYFLFCFETFFAVKRNYFFSDISIQNPRYWIYARDVTFSRCKSVLSLFRCPCSARLRGRLSRTVIKRTLGYHP